MVQTNAATAEESAAASEELSGQSSLLKQSVAKFKLRNNAHTLAMIDEYEDAYTQEASLAFVPIGRSKY